MWEHLKVFWRILELSTEPSLVKQVSLGGTAATMTHSITSTAVFPVPSIAHVMVTFDFDRLWPLFFPPSSPPHLLYVIVFRWRASFISRTVIRLKSCCFLSNLSVLITSELLSPRDTTSSPEPQSLIFCFSGGREWCFLHQLVYFTFDSNLKWNLLCARCLSSAWSMFLCHQAQEHMPASWLATVPDQQLCHGVMQNERCTQYYSETRTKLWRHGQLVCLRLSYISFRELALSFSATLCLLTKKSFWCTAFYTRFKS